MTDLAERLNKKAAAAKAEQEKKNLAAAKRRQALREKSIESIAQDFKSARLEHIEDVMEKMAAEGKFSYTVWTFHVSSRGGSELEEGTIRGMRYVRDWLIERGIDAELVEYDEEVLDYGRVHDWTLTASWEKI